MRTIKVTVTRDHVAEGIARSCTQCPIALAVYDALELKYPSCEEDVVLGVTDKFVTFYKTDKEHQSLLPQAVRHFIRLFDSHGRKYLYGTDNFSFDLQVPKQVI